MQLGCHTCTFSLGTYSLRITPNRSSVFLMDVTNQPFSSSLIATPPPATPPYHVSTQCCNCFRRLLFSSYISLTCWNINRLVSSGIMCLFSTSKSLTIPRKSEIILSRSTYLGNNITLSQSTYLRDNITLSRSTYLGTTDIWAINGHSTYIGGNPQPSIDTQPR